MPHLISCYFSLFVLRKAGNFSFLSWNGRKEGSSSSGSQGPQQLHPAPGLLQSVVCASIGEDFSFPPYQGWADLHRSLSNQQNSQVSIPFLFGLLSECWAESFILISGKPLKHEQQLNLAFTFNLLPHLYAFRQIQIPALIHSPLFPIFCHVKQR